MSANSQPQQLYHTTSEAVLSIRPCHNTLFRPHITITSLDQGMMSSASTLRHSGSLSSSRIPTSQRQNHQQDYFTYGFAQASSSSAGSSGSRASDLPQAAKRERSASISSLGSSTGSEVSSESLLLGSEPQDEHEDKTSSSIDRSGQAWRPESHHPVTTAAQAMSVHRIMNDRELHSSQVMINPLSIGTHAGRSYTAPHQAYHKRYQDPEELQRPPRLADVLSPLRQDDSDSGSLLGTTARARALPIASSKRRRVSDKQIAGGRSASATVDQTKRLFWQRQRWLMEHRGADGLSHCSSESEGEGDHDRHSAADDIQPGSPKASVTSCSNDVMRTAGAGLPLARVKRVMKNADPQIKVRANQRTLGEKSYSSLTGTDAALRPQR